MDDHRELDQDEKELMDKISKLNTELYQTEHELIRVRYEKDKLNYIFEVYCFDCDFREMEQISIGTNSLAYKCRRCSSTIVVKKKGVA